jgi:DNA excision repair protein ERCC-5
VEIETSESIPQVDESLLPVTTQTPPQQTSSKESTPEKPLKRLFSSFSSPFRENQDPNKLFDLDEEDIGDLGTPVEIVIDDDSEEEEFVEVEVSKEDLPLEEIHEILDGTEEDLEESNEIILLDTDDEIAEEESEQVFPPPVSPEGTDVEQEDPDVLLAASENRASEVIEDVMESEAQGEDETVEKEARPVEPQVEEKEEDLQEEMDQIDITDVPTNLEEENQEFSRFVSELSSNPSGVREMLQTEIDVLSVKQRKDLRDAADISTEMMQETQELLRLFGLPYLVAPTEAESQCAFLAESGLVNGIVTDDSDVFLFGGQKVYRHFFNQQKYCELFTLDEVEEKLGLERDRMVRLAYLLGSDYTSGLTGIGPVTALEILREWDSPGLESLEEFKKWAIEAQRQQFDPNDSPIRKKLVRFST